MLDALRGIVQAVSAVSDLEEAARIIVDRVREAIGADGCSIFLFQESARQYVLMATNGLSPDAVGRVRLAPGEGLVGFVGAHHEPINAANAAEDPRFLAVPEAGEETFRAFLGVPVIHRGRPTGVLAVQRRAATAFTEDECSFLVTIAAQLAGLINQAALDLALVGPMRDGTPEARFLPGIPGAPGVAVGEISLIHLNEDLDSIPNRPVTDSAAETEAFRSAVVRVQEDLRSGGARMAAGLGAEERALFDVYVMLAGNEPLVSGTLRRIEAGNWAPAALRDAIAEQASVFERMDDPYLRARGEDIRAIGRHILRRLRSDAGGPARSYPSGCVLVGEEIGVAEIAEVPAHRLAGILCTRGSALSHTAILARGLGVPAVMGLGELTLGDLEGREVVVDGYQGRVYIEPTDAVRAEYDRLAAEEAALNKGLEGLRDLPAKTPDGVRLALYMNSGLLADLPRAAEVGAEGVGLFRTELAYLARDSFPGEEELYRAYRRVLLLLAPKPVTMRTLDVGGDKPLPYFSSDETNPFLGWRGIRVTLDHPEILLTQLRAMLRANAGLNNLRILLPMVSRAWEVDRTIEFIDQAHKALLDDGRSSAKPPLGVMIETPASLYQMSSLVRRVDFFSVGTNDLAQYLLVVDRNNALVASLYDGLHPAVLRAIRQVADEAHRWGRPVGVCGEMAGDPAAALLLLGMGVDSLSMAASDLPRVKRVIRAFDQEKASRLTSRALLLEEAHEVRSLLNGALEQADLGGLIRAGW
jgi:phosphotransferase system enzyme I (PtsP)